MTRTDTLPASRALAFLRILTGLGLLFGAYGKFMIFRVAGAVPFPVVALHWQLELPARLATWLVQHPTGMLSAIVRDLLVPHATTCVAQRYRMRLSETAGFRVCPHPHRPHPPSLLVRVPARVPATLPLRRVSFRARASRLPPCVSLRFSSRFPIIGFLLKAPKHLG